jgi:hypothetical protein
MYSIGVNGVLVELVTMSPCRGEGRGFESRTYRQNFISMKYKLMLSNGATVYFDEYSISKKGISYRNGTVEVYMTNDMFKVGTIERVRKIKK